MIEAAICSRLSSREQQQKGFSLKGQAKLLREYAERNGFEIVKAFEGVETAKASPNAKDHSKNSSV
jgi:DNA invertase Pin-like site-specific DNA recombinase